MTSTTVPETAAPAFNIEDARAEIELLNESYQSKMAALVAAGQAGDVQAMTSLGSEMAKIAIQRDKLAARIKRAEGGNANVDLATRIAARTEAYAAVSTMADNDAVKRLLTLVPTVRRISLNFKDGKFVDVSGIGGFRENAQGKKRSPRPVWTGASFSGEKNSREVRALFATKYGAVKSEKDMTSAERAALTLKIAEGEGLTNKNAK